MIALINWPALNIEGVGVGLAAFLIIGVFHPIVIKAEYRFGKQVWPFFFIAGVIFILISMTFEGKFISVILGVTGFALFWSTLELFKQHQRVLKGQARKNPQRTYHKKLLPGTLLLGTMNLTGIIVGAGAFVCIAAGRYLTIKAEYYFTKRFWIGFLIIGIGCILLSLSLSSFILSSILAILGFTFLWGIGEILEQEKRVEKGWFPKNPKRT